MIDEKVYQVLLHTSRIGEEGRRRVFGRVEAVETLMSLWLGVVGVTRVVPVPSGGRPAAWRMPTTDGEERGGCGDDCRQRRGE